MTFTEWLLRSVDRNTIRGDLARDVRDDKLFPRDPRSIDEILNAMGPAACDGAVRAAKRAWRDYRRVKRAANSAP